MAAHSAGAGKGGRGAPSQPVLISSSCRVFAFLVLVLTNAGRSAVGNAQHWAVDSGELSQTGPMYMSKCATTRDDKTSTFLCSLPRGPVQACPYFSLGDTTRIQWVGLSKLTEPHRL